MLQFGVRQVRFPEDEVDTVVPVGFAISGGFAMAGGFSMSGGFALSGGFAISGGFTMSGEFVMFQGISLSVRGGQDC